MSYVPNYEHDIFISYARVDNDPLPGAEVDKVTGRKRGWVSTLILDGLKKELAKQLGRADSYSLWMDDAGLPGNESVTQFIDKQVKNSATVLFIVSPGYLASPWCRLEFNTFLEQMDTESGRLFMVETQRLDQDEKLPEFEYTEMGWPITPEGFHANIMEIVRRYNPKKLVITENGSAWADELDSDGRIRDGARSLYLVDHLQQVHRAIQDGAPLTGYLAWSFIDNYEWSCGYRPRFGLVYNDYETQKRTIKDSGYLFAEIIRANGI